MRMRSKVAIAALAVTAATVLWRCSGPAHETIQKPAVVEQARTEEGAPKPKAGETTAKPTQEQDTKPKTQDTRQAEAPCPSVVYEPDERCGLERRPWKGGPISEEELVKGEETLRLHSEDTKCVEDWIRKWGEKIHRGEDIPRDAYRCSENSAELEKLPPALMSCEESQIKSLVDLTINGSKIVQDKGVDILITWNKTAAELVITVRNEKTKKEEEHRFRFNMRPRYAIVSTDKRIISTNKNYVELVIFDGKTQLRLGLDKSCRPIYEIYEPTY